MPLDETQGFEVFFKENQTILYRVVKGYMKAMDISKDIVLEAMEIVYERWEHIKSIENPAGYTMRVAINLAKKYLIKNKLNRITQLPDGDENGYYISEKGNPEDAYLEKEELQMITEQLERLNDKERNVILLRDLEQKKFEEIASFLKQNVSTVKSLYRRGKIKISEQMEAVYD
jgi:RNA polymerase sigma-70 factor, ECF subfamily